MITIGWILFIFIWAPISIFLAYRAFFAKKDWEFIDIIGIVMISVTLSVFVNLALTIINTTESKTLFETIIKILNTNIF